MGKLRKLLFIAISLSLAVFAWATLTKKTDTKSQTNNSASVKTRDTEFTASFEINTNSTKRIFTDSRYHNLSPEIYIENPDPSVVYVKKSGITWGDFFETLPMKLTKECLTTGTGQLFCTGKNGKLSFFINNKEKPEALEIVIHQNDKLTVTYISNK